MTFVNVFMMVFSRSISPQKVCILCIRVYLVSHQTAISKTIQQSSILLHFLQFALHTRCLLVGLSLRQSGLNLSLFFGNQCKFFCTFLGINFSNQLILFLFLTSDKFILQCSTFFVACREGRSCSTDNYRMGVELVEDGLTLWWDNIV